MNKQRLFIACFILASAKTWAQLPTCIGGGSLVYFNNYGTLYNYDPSLPVSGTNPWKNTIAAPGGTGALAVCRNLNGSGPSPTFYTLDHNEYKYYNGSGWVSTGDTGIALNIAGGANYIFSLVGVTGEVYRYDGTGNPTYLTTINGFYTNGWGVTGGAIFDLVADCDDNFYVLKLLPQASAFLRKYNAQGVLVNSWTVTSNLSFLNGGAGMAMIGNTIYFDGNSSFYQGTITGTNVTIFSLGTNTNTVYDMASCALGVNGITSVGTIPDTAFYCGSGPGVKVKPFGNGPFTWSVISGPATITGPDTLITVTSAANSKILLKGHPTFCAIDSTDTLDVFVPTATVKTGVADSFFYCGNNTDTLTATLTNKTPGLNYNIAWTPVSFVVAGGNTLTPVVNPPATTQFKITVSVTSGSTGCTWSDSVIKPVANVNIHADFTTNIKPGCETDTVHFTNTSTGYGTLKYQWNFGDNNIFFSPKDTTYLYGEHGLYQAMLIATSKYCADTAFKTVNVNHPLDAAFTIYPAFFCLHDSVFFDGSMSVAQQLPTPPVYAWDFGDGKTSASIKPVHVYDVVKKYRVRLIVTDFIGCSDTAYHDVEPDLRFPFIDLGPADTLICAGEKLYLPLGISIAGASYLWSDGSTSPRFIVDKAGVYSVRISNDCGEFTDEITIDTKNCKIWLPSAFSPNGDGKNEVLRIGGALADIEKCEFAIYDRRGNKMFYTTDENEGWDGSYNGIPQPGTTYYYYIQYTASGKQEMLKGDITLVR